MINAVMLYTTLCFIIEMIFEAVWEVWVVYMDNSIDYNFINAFKAIVIISKQIMILMQSVTIILAACYIAMFRDDKTTTYFRETAAQEQEAIAGSWIVPKSSINNDEIMHNQSVSQWSNTKSDLKTDYRVLQQNNGDHLVYQGFKKPTNNSNDNYASPNLST